MNIELGSCVKVFGKNSECTKCADVCPENSITYIDNIPQIATNCTDCGLCLGVCPTEATSIKDQDPLDYAFKFLEQKETTLTCGENIPCNSILHVEHIISLALLNTYDSLNLECCDQCYNITSDKIKEANYFIDKLGSAKKINIHQKQEVEETETGSPNRRDFLKRLSLKGAVKSKIEFEQEVEKLDKKLDSNDSAKIRQKELPNKRKFLYMALKRVDKLSHFEKLEQNNISFISQKIINDSCDNCSMCYRLCPTGALQSDRRNSKIEFDALSCVKCHLCHDVCELNSITIDDFNTKNIFEPKIEHLISFDIFRCDDCGNFFTSLNGEKSCHRCKIEEEEAKELWGIQ